LILTELLSHPLYPFDSFRADDTAFSLLTRYWAAVAREALGASVFAACEPLQPPDRDAEGWGDPLMLDIWIPAQRRGARVLLLEAIKPKLVHSTRAGERAKRPSIYLYLSRRGVTGPDDVIDQICFRADMGDGARSVVQEFLHVFLVDCMDLDSVEQSIQVFEDEMAVSLLSRGNRSGPC
jgi:hypothetical protein